MTFPTISVGTICDLVNGKAFKPSDWSPYGYPIIRIQNLNDQSKPFNYWNGTLERQVCVKTGDVLLAWSGTPGTSFGAHIWRGDFGVLNQHIFRVDLDESRIHKDWFVNSINYQLNDLIALAHGGVGLKHVTRGMVDSLEIPLPSLEEQSRIVEIFDQADQVRSSRQIGIIRIENLYSSTFLSMFGEPTCNNRGWPRMRLFDLLAEIESGWSPKCHEHPADLDQWGVLKLGAITKCEYNDSEQKALPQSQNPQPSLEVRPGDILFSRKNTHDLVAACVFVEKTRSKLLMSDLIFRLKIRDGAPIDPRYLQQLLIFPTKRKEIQKLASGAAGSMPNISKGRLMEAEIEVPPLDLQRAFAARVAEIDKLKALHRAHLAKLDELFASLQHRAFRGEL